MAGGLPGKANSIGDPRRTTKTEARSLLATISLGGGVWGWVGWEDVGGGGGMGMEGRGRGWGGGVSNTYVCPTLKLIMTSNPKLTSNPNQILTLTLTA